jgi:hypothetical protein
MGLAGELLESIVPKTRLAIPGAERIQGTGDRFKIQDLQEFRTAARTCRRFGDAERSMNQLLGEKGKVLPKIGKSKSACSAIPVTQDS